MTAPVVPTRADRRARGAVMALFAVNGATYSSLVPRFPALRDGLAEFQRADGVWAPASTWIVSASVPDRP